MRCAGQTGVKQADTTADRLLAGFVDLACIQIFFGQVLDDQVDQRIVELGSHQQPQPFDLAPVDHVAMQQNTAGRFDDADAFAAFLQVGGSGSLKAREDNDV